MKAIEQSSSEIEVKAFIENQEKLSLLRFITCGSVDDGKSTLIGKVLFESKVLFQDQITTLMNDSKKHGTQGHDFDYALLVDGLSAEREQGITIDVAYRFFSTDKRKFIVADTPGHEQYTRNMITGASTADLAVILVDARKGILEQTKRHTFLTSLVGVKHIILAVNKMDLVNYDENTYQDIVNYYREFTRDLNFKTVIEIPLSALKGDNIKENNNNLNWYKGPSLIPLLETINTELTIDKKNKDNLRLPIQYVLRPDLDFRAFCGKIVSGNINIGDSIKVMPSGVEASIKSMYVGERPLRKGVEGQSLSVVLDKEVDISRGDLIVSKSNSPESSNQFEIDISWLSEDDCFKGRGFIAKIGTQKVRCQITELKYKIDINSLKKLPTKSITLNEIACIKINLEKNVTFDPYSINKSTGAMILIDPINNQTVAAGMIKHSLRRATNIHKHHTSISRSSREKINGHKGMVLWFTGLSGSGKSTIADALEKNLHNKGYRTYLLDGDNVRHGLNQDLGFSEPDRIENIRRVSEVAKLMLDAGIFVLSSFISPFEADRAMAKSIFDKNDFIEIYVHTSLKTAEKRDPKGLYKKARAGKIPNFTGISSPYEKPRNPDILIDTETSSIEKSVLAILKELSIE